MPDDTSPPAETSHIPVSDGLANTPSEPIAPVPSDPVFEPTPEASASAPSEPAKPVIVAAPEAVAAEPQSEVETPEPEPSPQKTQGAAPVASAPNAVSTKSPEHDRELLKIARAKIQTNKQQNFEKLLKLFDTKEKITNDDVEKALRCSDRSATRYLKELVKQGKIKRVGETGAGVVYIKA